MLSNFLLKKCVKAVRIVFGEWFYKKVAALGKAKVYITLNQDTTRRFIRRTMQGVRILFIVKLKGLVIWFMK